MVSYKEKALNFDYLGSITLVGGTTALLLAISWGGNSFPWAHQNVLGCLIGGIALVVLFVVIQHFVKDPLLPPSFLRSRAIVAIFLAEFFYGANLLGMMYYVPQFFQLVFGDSATIAGVGLLPMMLGLGVGNPVAAWITSKYGISLANAIVGAALEVLISALMTRWNADTSRAEAVVLLILLGVGQGAVMSGLLLSAQVSVEPLQIGLVTGLVIFMQTVGDIFGIAFFAAVYVNELKSFLSRINISPEQIEKLLQNVQSVKTGYSPEIQTRIIEIYADSLKNGWWLMFACAAACLICSCCAKQHKF